MFPISGFSSPFVESSQATTQKKKVTENRSTTIAHHALRSKRKRELDESEAPEPKRAKTLRPIRHENLLFECTRDEAFMLGAEMRMKLMIERLAELAPEIQDKLNLFTHAHLVEHPKMDAETKRISAIAKKHSTQVASQLVALCNMCDQAHGHKKAFALKVKEFAFAIAEELPILEEEVEEIEEQYLTLAQTLAKNSPIELTEDQVLKLAAKLQKADAGDPMDTDNPAEADAIRTLGYLLLVAKDDLPLAAACVSSQGRDQQILNLGMAACEKIGDFRYEIEEKGVAHLNAGLQSYDEAQYRTMALSMAKLILIENSGINFGILDVLMTNLVPIEFKESEAIKCLEIIIKKLKNSPELWQQIAEMKKPAEKDMPSNDLIRASIGLKGNEPVTDYHAQLAALSALLDNLRQANAGTCFATAWLIKILLNNTDSCLEDFREILETSQLQRISFGESRTYPFQIIMTNENLDTCVTVDEAGRILNIHDPYETKEEAGKHEFTEGTFLHSSPGIRSVCNLLNIDDPENAITEILPRFNQKPFPIKHLLDALAAMAFEKNQNMRHMRSRQQYTFEEMNRRAYYAYVAEVRHPLHRAWEQISTEIVNYFGSQYLMPFWTFENMSKILLKHIPTQNSELKKMYHTALKHLCLPVISRMRYKYNHYFDDSFILFEERNYSIDGEHGYGYQLFDTGLPKDFVYSTDLYNRFKNETSSFHPEPFQEYAPTNEWKLIKSEEDFLNFIQDNIRQTLAHLITLEPAKADQWQQVETLLNKGIKKSGFIPRLIGSFFMAKDLKKNPHTVRTLPWLFKWGGDPEKVVQNYYNFKEYPVREHQYAGSPKEVLIRHINLIKKQPEELKDLYKDPSYLTPVCSPCHAFNIKPSKPSFIEAYTSDLDANQFVTEKVENPGLQVADSILFQPGRNALIDYVANNMWYRPSDAKHEFLRQELTELSKQAFDREMDLMPQNLTGKDFCEYVLKAVATSRAAHPKIQKRNTAWEAIFKTAFMHKIKELNLILDQPLEEQAARTLIDFARNRRDQVELSPDAARKLREVMQGAPRNMTAFEFRQMLVTEANRLHYEENYIKDKEWIETLAPRLDTKLFSLLAEKDQKKLLESAIVVHDTNWNKGIHHVLFAFLVNPGTKKIELVNYYLQNQKITLNFRDQSHWFPSDGGHWSLPGNYRSFAKGPIFNTQKYMEV